MIVDSFNLKTDKFETLAEATVSELFGLIDPCEVGAKESTILIGDE